LPRNETRFLATAAEASSTPYDTIPFHGLAQAWGTRTPNPELSKLQTWDTSNPLVVHNTLATVASPVTPIKFGVGGDPIELHQNLYACLRVGRMDRATAILQRLTDMYNPGAPEVVDAHTIFLQSLFDQARQNPSSKSMAEIEAWYNSKMVSKGIESTAQTFVTLLRASMTFLEGSEQDNMIQKYISEAHEYGEDMMDEVNESGDWTDAEWNMLIKYQSDEYNEPPPVEHMKSMQISTPRGQELAIEHGLIADPSLEVKSVPQKGMGLQTLKESLKIFEHGADVPYPHELDGTKEEKDRAWAYMRQIRLEQDATRAATERWRAEDEKLQEIGIHGVLQSKPIQALMWNWYKTLVPRLEEEIRKTKEVLSNPSPTNLRDERHIYGPYLEECDPKQMAALAVSRVLSSCAKGPRDDQNMLKLTSLTVGIGRDIESQVNDNIKQRYENFMRKTRKQTRKEVLAKLSKNQSSRILNEAKRKTTPVDSNIFQQKEFPLHVKVQIGALVLENLMQSAMITVTKEDPKTGQQLTATQPAFHHHVGFVTGKRISWVAPHHEVFSKLRSEPVYHIQTVKLPMLVEPKPWASFEEGGYFTIKDQVIRTKMGDISQKAYGISAIENGDMTKVLAGLDSLGRVPWNINGDVFRVMAQAWNSGESVGGLVPEEHNLVCPADLGPDATYAERMKYNQKMKEYQNTTSGLHSQRCFQNFQLEVARGFLNEKFYYPHSVDFRGRAYPIPPVLNHIGADFSRGLLKFANGKELGTVGLQWLKVHLANLYGYDKASLRDREQFAMDNLNEVYDSATNPLDGNRWWTKAEDPWQCLACCMELKNALDSPEPTRYISHLPVHQDGTCNGLQHYAALGGDQAGANQVNLEPSDRPQDIYTGVAELVKELVAQDAEKGNAVAAFMDGKVTRRVVKRTVMTNVYGVTFMGAKLQVLDELKELFPNFTEQPGIPNLVIPALYIAKKIFQALAKIFNGAQEIQYWLGECGDRITTSLAPDQIRNIQERMNGQPLCYDEKYKQPKKVSERSKKKLDKGIESFKTGIIWTTPLKMPVVQPYRKDSLQSVKTKLAHISVAKQSPNDVVDKRKQLQAFPPNFIHSLDATHMILSALKCSELGLDFAAVHDSFWTHAADIPALNIVLRDAFVRMHNEDIIGRLAAEFQARYSGHMYCASLVATSPVAQEITAWRKEWKAHQRALKRGGEPAKGAQTARFGEASFTELALEAKRRELLNSENAEERKEGESMVTPTSIWEKWGDLGSFSSHRLSLLGEEKSGKVSQEVKEKVLGAQTSSLEPQSTVTVATEDAEASVDLDASCEAIGEAPRKSNSGRPRKDPKDCTPSTKAARASGRAQAANVKVWLPLSFPPVPKKGDWDVKRLRESKYFFS
jgi:DNA-directed RNA polymerase